MIAVVALNDIPSVKGAKKISSFEMRQGENIFESCLSEAGLRMEDITFLSLAQTSALSRLKPSIIVALGNEAAWSLVDDWPDTRGAEGLEHRGNIFGATDIENRRGYVFDSRFDCPVIVTVHPANIARTWVPWRVLLSYDLQRTKELHDEHLCRPERKVELVTSPGDARDAVKQLRRYRWLASDIETWGDTSLACVGFAGDGGEAFVFPARYLSDAGELLRSPSIGNIWVNGIYDLFCLKHREGVDVRGRQDDAMLLWAACYPELAGRKEDKKKAKMTRKSLSFLASLFTFDEWWKGVYESEEEFFIYCGKDNCITNDVWVGLKKLSKDLGSWETYEHLRKSMWPCVDMLQRGLNVDDDLRRERIEKLSEGFEEIYLEMNELIAPLLEREREALIINDTLRLFEETDVTCECCGHGKKKQMACWSCAGFEKAPSKVEMVAAWDFIATDVPTRATPLLTPTKDMSKKDLETYGLHTCKVCKGLPRETRLRWNPNSGSQNKVILYDVLRLPKRLKQGKLTSDEEALRGILGGIA